MESHSEPAELPRDLRVAPKGRRGRLTIFFGFAAGVGKTYGMLEAGIDVYTTLNVQHLESLNDVVAQITGIAVQETVPDTVFDRADEITIVDLPPRRAAATAA
jgi:K+-sensing histidine kinase KdpD